MSSTSRPTILDIAGIQLSLETVDGIEQDPMHGTSFRASLTDGAAPEHRTQQYFETIANRGMYKDGWWLAMRTERIPWVLTPDAVEALCARSVGPGRGPRRTDYLPDDFSQAKDLAADNPEKVEELKDLFWEEAGSYKVLATALDSLDLLRLVPPIPRRRSSSSGATSRTCCRG